MSPPLKIYYTDGIELEQMYDIISMGKLRTTTDGGAVRKWYQTSNTHADDIDWLLLTPGDI